MIFILADHVTLGRSFNLSLTVPLCIHSACVRIKIMKAKFKPIYKVKFLALIFFVKLSGGRKAPDNIKGIPEESILKNIPLPHTFHQLDIHSDKQVPLSDTSW